jgi:hypothetical protein
MLLTVCLDGMLIWKRIVLNLKQRMRKRALQ